MPTLLLEIPSGILQGTQIIVKTLALSNCGYTIDSCRSSYTVLVGACAFGHILSPRKFSWPCIDRQDQRILTSRN